MTDISTSPTPDDDGLNDAIQQAAERLVSKKLLPEGVENEKLQTILGSLDAYDLHDREELLMALRHADMQSNPDWLPAILTVMQQSKEYNAFTFMLSWGGYYAYKTDDGSYALWRLLDLNQHVVHCARYKTKFKHVPTLAEAKSAEIFAMHVPLAPIEMLDKDQVYVGHAELTVDDLEGYEVYLQAHDYSKQQTTQIIQAVIGYSTENPSRVHLYENPEFKGSIVFIGKTA